MVRKATEKLNFIQAVQQSLVKQPTQVGFSSSEWDNAFRTYGSGTEDELRMYEAGLWFAEKLTAIRQSLAEFPDAQHDADKLSRYYVAAVNRDYAVMGQASAEDYTAKAGSTTTSGEIIERQLPIGPCGYSIRLEATLESLVSAIRYPLTEISKSSVTTGQIPSTDLEILKNVMIRTNLAILYDNLSHFWSECLWNGWFISKRNDADFIVPSQTPETKSRILSQHRSDTLSLELTWRSITHWKKLPKEIRDLELNLPRITQIERHKKKVDFRLGHQKNDEFPPWTFIAGIAAEELYWDNLLLEPLPKMSGLTIREIQSVWYVLASLGETLKVNAPRNTEVRNLKQLMQFAPRIPVPSLKKAVQKATGLSYKKVDAAIEMFMFNWSVRQDPWFKPIVSISDHECTVLIPSLTVPNLIRSIESWMKDGGINMSERGIAFEDYVRTHIRESIDESELLSQLIMTSRPIEITDGNVTEQIDLVLLIGSVMIVCEIKCAIYPAGPIEYYNYYQILHGASKQAERKVQFTKLNISKVLSALGIEIGIDAGSIAVYPLVITNLHLGAGVIIDRVPVSDLNILDLYFKGSQRFFIEASAEGEGEAIHTEIFYSSPEEAEARLIPYLLYPPGLKIFDKWIDCQMSPLPPLMQNEKPIVYARYYVKEPAMSNGKIDPLG